MPIIRIRQHAFELSRQWHTGHPLNEAEAQALTGLFCENVRNNVDEWVLKVLAGRQALTFIEHAELQRRIGDYARTYEFKTRPASETSISPLERHARSLAEQELRVELGLGPDDTVPESAVLTRATSSSIRNQAIRKLEAERKIAAEALAALL